MLNDDLTVLADIAAKPRTRPELEREFGRVWNAEELAEEFIVTAIIPPTYLVRKKLGGVVGAILCQPRPLLYFRFVPSPDQM